MGSRGNEAAGGRRRETSAGTGVAVIDREPATPPDLGGFVDADPPPATGLSATRLSDLHAALGRYEPALAVVVVLSLAALVLPGPTIRAADRFFTAPTLPAQSAGTSDEPPAPDTVALETGEVVIDSGALAPSGFDFTPTAPERGTAAPASLPAPPQAATGAGGGSAPAEVAPTHTIVAAGWATANAATIGGVGVPEGGLPVGRRLGEDDKLSFVRLGASSTRLVLRLVDDAGGQRFADSATVQACRILVAGWEAKPAMSMSEAPPHDRTSCAVGERNDDGTWTFDLSRFTDRTDQKGFALVPGPDAPADFQVTFDSAVV